MTLRPHLLKIATRRSKLALIQSNMIREALLPHCDRPIELLAMESTGDKITDRALLDIGGKGLFTKEIEEALLSRNAQIAMHSLKDVPAKMPEELMLAAALPREDYHDALIAQSPLNSLHDLPQKAKIGTSSPRRAAQLRKNRPDLQIVDFRGNVPTRLRKLQEGQVDATILAVAGLKRLNMQKHISVNISETVMLPAIGQGIVVMQCRKDDAETRDLLAKINHAESWQQLLAERAILEYIEGDCKSPLAGLATIHGDTMTIKGMILNADGSQFFETEHQCDPKDAIAGGKRVGAALLERSKTLWV